MVPYVNREVISERLPIIFPEGTPNRNYCIRQTAAIAIFTMLYVDAAEGSASYLAPVQVYRMTIEQSLLSDSQSRVKYATESLKKNYKPAGKRFYADNSREPIRDESIREGLIPIGAIKFLPEVPTTSSRGRYYLEAGFADLFNPSLIGESFTEAARVWQEVHLSQGALRRVTLMGLSQQSNEGQIMVRFPNGNTIPLSQGPSEIISKAVIEDFTARFLRQPGVLWLSTSKDKSAVVQLEMAREIGLDIRVDRDLPDIILVDLAPAHPLLVFVEVVASDGPVTNRRQEAIYKLTDAGHIDRANVVFVTAYMDRESGAFSKTAKAIAWNSFAWFLSEPEKIMVLGDGTFLSDMITYSL
jgi:hypothetical protein